ncbi:hypothetical protein K502DRAFT_349489 [Neoconidiobolus thromboides FSU 785]|nr:hypothetical protein K502DRAFT_349489 [Neoconidiobolus thromboides FSU 785]
MLIKQDLLLPPSYDEIDKVPGSSRGPSPNYSRKKEIMNFIVKTSGMIERTVNIKSDDGTEYITNVRTKSAEYKNKDGNLVLALKECNFHYMYTLWEIINVAGNQEYRNIKFHSVINKNRPLYFLYLIDNEGKMTEYKWEEGKSKLKWKLYGPDNIVILEYKYAFFSSSTLKQFIYVNETNLDIFLFSLGVILNDSQSRRRQVTRD